jgi:hypothetical protein
MLKKNWPIRIPSLEFWVDTASLALVSGENTVSLNMLDVAINTTNRFDLKDSVVKFVQTRVWNELLHALSKSYGTSKMYSGNSAGGLTDQPKQLVPVNRNG